MKEALGVARGVMGTLMDNIEILPDWIDVSKGEPEEFGSATDVFLEDRDTGERVSVFSTSDKGKDGWHPRFLIEHVDIDGNAVFDGSDSVFVLASQSSMLFIASYLLAWSVGAGSRGLSELLYSWAAEGNLVALGGER